MFVTCTLLLHCIYKCMCIHTCVHIFYIYISSLALVQSVKSRYTCVYNYICVSIYIIFVHSLLPRLWPHFSSVRHVPFSSGPMFLDISLSLYIFCATLLQCAAFALLQGKCCPSSGQMHISLYFPLPILPHFSSVRHFCSSSEPL